MSKLIVGCGYLGERVARLWRGAGEEVSILTRSQERAENFARRGYQPLVGNIVERREIPVLPVVDTVLFAVGYDHNSKESIERVYGTGLANVLSRLPAETGRVIYISSTGVYGPANGASVDEMTATDPQRAGGKASLMAEKTLATDNLGPRSIILRLAGIYGPSRIPHIDQLRNGEPLAVPSGGWLNLIHVDDAAAIVVAADRWAQSISLATGPEIFCVSDGNPVVRGEYYREVARLVGAPDPVFVSPDPNSPASQRAHSDKRISNRKLLTNLKIQLVYGDYRAGLAAILGK